MTKKWRVPFSTQSYFWKLENKYKNILPIERLGELFAIWNSDVYEKLSEPNKRALEKIIWEVEYNLGINDKPCMRCGDKTDWGQYYCEACKHREDHEQYQIVQQRMHEEKYNIKNKMNMKEMFKRNAPKK